MNDIDIHLSVHAEPDSRNGMKQFEHGRNHTTCLTCAPTSPGLTT
jgi:hypothetical protein